MRSRQLPVPVFVVGGVVVALLATGVFLTLRDDRDPAAPSARADSPLDVTRRYLAAYPNRDCDALIDLLTEESWSEGGLYTRQEALQRCRDSQGQLAMDSAFEAIRVTAQDQERATVAVQVTHYDGSTARDEIRLLRLNGRWKVDQTAAP